MPSPETLDWTRWPPVLALVLLAAALIPVRMYNVPLFFLLNASHTPLTDELWLCFTTLGDGLLVAIIIGAFLVVNPRVTVMGLLILVLSNAAVHILKALFPVLRPAGLFASVHVVGPLLKGGSFPSGHTAAGMSAALAIAHFAPSKKAAAVALFMAGLVSLSRIFVGAHFPVDVLVGMMCALAAYVVARNFLWPRIEELVPGRPLLDAIPFMVALAVEAIAVLIAMTLYAANYAESPAFAVMVGVAVLVFFVYGLEQAGIE